MALLLPSPDVCHLAAAAPTVAKIPALRVEIVKRTAVLPRAGLSQALIPAKTFSSGRGRRTSPSGGSSAEPVPALSAVSGG